MKHCFRKHCYFILHIIFYDNIIYLHRKTTVPFDVANLHSTVYIIPCQSFRNRNKLFYVIGSNIGYKAIVSSYQCYDNCDYNVSLLKHNVLQSQTINQIKHLDLYFFDTRGTLPFLNYELIVNFYGVLPKIT